MNKDEFLKLSEKFQKNDCSEIEKNILFDFCEQAQLKDLSTNWSFSEEEATRARVLQKITNQIKTEQKQHSKVYRLKKISAIAAVFAGLIMGSYFYLQNSSPDNLLLAEKISIQLENGQIINLEDFTADSIFDKKGSFVAHFESNKLVYTKTSTFKNTRLNTLYVPNGKNFTLQLADGTQINVNAGTSVTYPIDFYQQKSRQVAITGEAFLEVAKDSLHPFIVDMGAMNVKVFGTAFNVQNYTDSEFSEIVLEEGSVGLYAPKTKLSENPTLFLKPGEKADFNKISNNFTKQEVNVRSYVAWKDGELIYKNMPFGHILKKLERHFAVNIICQNEKLSEEIFNANFGKNAELIDVLKDLKINYNIDYTIQDNNIIIK